MGVILIVFFSVYYFGALLFLFFNHWLHESIYFFFIDVWFLFSDMIFISCNYNIVMGFTLRYQLIYNYIPIIIEYA
ncbi:hypothetical protein A9255_15135 [Xenorhabdus hominickii]|uniref:Uncharacterized protein n=1 Tax=Xenorhabdus hominickii TaxID=351679 RepID=A0A2G0QEU4_XENHO|nr:hypothetical protein A9255_15135 [Xenorhabdus hominickii]PHM57734.1 hypothetical protein Xhom_00732 [Xenorhabdus hominickii]